MCYVPDFHEIHRKCLKDNRTATEMDKCPEKNPSLVRPRIKILCFQVKLFGRKKLILLLTDKIMIKCDYNNVARENKRREMWEGKGIPINPM